MEAQFIPEQEEARKGRKLLTPIKELFDFDRVHDIKAGTTSSVSFDISPSSFASADDQGNLVVFPGEYVVYIEEGSDSKKTIELTVNVEGDKTTIERFVEEY